MTRHRFREIKVTAHKKAKCPQCGRAVQRQKTFSQTVNPFNKDAQGQVKSAAVIYNEVKIEAHNWSYEPEVCKRCLDLS